MIHRMKVVSIPFRKTTTHNSLDSRDFDSSSEYSDSMSDTSSNSERKIV